MKKLITLLFVSVMAVSTYATHLMGGQIITSYLGTDSLGSHYAVELTAYRDTIGVPIGINAVFNVSELDTSGNWNSLFSSTVSYDTSSGGLFLPVQSAYGVEVYVYNDTITVPGDGYYSISYQECCRNGAIINMSNPLSESMRLTTYFTSDSVNPNSSASYTTPPVAYLPAHTLWQYNPLPFDPDGDSLAWSLATPLGATNPVAGYEYLSDSAYSDSAAVFSLDSITGALTWSAKMAGNFVASFVIDEYRNGVNIGSMRRDMQFIVIPDTSNTMPQISNMQSIPTNSGGYPYIVLSAYQNYQLHLLASDADVNDVVDMIGFGEAFDLTTAPSTLNVLPTGNGNEIEGTFSWTPDISAVRTAPYITVFRVSDQMFYFDETIQFEVSSSTGVDDNNGFTIDNIYPNPVNNMMYVPLILEKGALITMDIYNILGVKVYQSGDMNFTAGNHLILKNINLNSGQYMVSIKDSSGNILSTERIIVVK
jgi:hypothetical protein